jgi:dTMP kinase
MTGKLIVIEGLEGAGKTTAIRTITDLLSAHNLHTITTREPGGTDIGEILRSVIKDCAHSGVLDNKSELLLFYAARIQLLEEVIKPALQAGTWVIADRFELSTLAYQGGGRGLSQPMIKQLSTFCLDGFKPNLTIYLDIPPELGMQRVRLRGEFDRIEQQSIDFFHRVHDAYLQCIQHDPNVATIDATLPLDEVQAEIQKAVRAFL